LFLRLVLPSAISRLFRPSLAVLLTFLATSSVATETRSLTSDAASSFSELSARADAARDGDRLDEAISLYRRALVLRPSWAEGWWSLGTVYYDRDAYDKAAVSFKKMIALQPQNGTAQAMLGLCEFELGREQLALRHIQKGKSLGLQKNPELWQVVLYHEGVLLQRKGSLQAAQDTLEELCLQAGQSDRVAAVLGMTMLRLSDNEPPSPGSADADLVLRVGRAECLAGQKKYDDARSAFEEVAKQYPNFPNVHYAFGLFLIELRDVTESIVQFKQEIANHPENVLSRLRIASVEYKEDSAAGIPYAEEAVKLDPQQPFGHYLLGLLRLDVDDYRGAIPELEIAQKAFSHEARIFLALATAYSRAGRKQDAIRARARFQRLTNESKTISGNPAPAESDVTSIPVADAPALPQ